MMGDASQASPTADAVRPSAHPADILERAADRLERPGAWAQGALGYRANGEALGWGSNLTLAVCWCASGALRVEGADRGDGPLSLGSFARLLPLRPLQSIPDWNDTHGRTQAEVVAALRKAAALARSTDGASCASITDDGQGPGRSE